MPKLAVAVANAPPAGMATAAPCSTIHFQPSRPSHAPLSHGEAALALHIHEVGVGGGYQALQLVLPLLQLRRGVQQVDVARQHLRGGQSNVPSMHKRGSVHTRAYRLPGHPWPIADRGTRCRVPAALGPLPAILSGVHRRQEGARAARPPGRHPHRWCGPHGACCAVLAAAGGCQMLVPPPQGPPLLLLRPPRLHGAAAPAHHGC